MVKFDWYWLTQVQDKDEQGVWEARGGHESKVGGRRATGKGQNGGCTDGVRGGVGKERGFFNGFWIFLSLMLSVRGSRSAVYNSQKKRRGGEGGAGGNWTRETRHRFTLSPVGDAMILMNKLFLKCQPR